jgi:hypothetical protein
LRSNRHCRLAVIARDNGREQPSSHQDCVDGQLVRGAIAFMTRPFSGAMRIHPAVIKNDEKK